MNIFQPLIPIFEIQKKFFKGRKNFLYRYKKFLWDLGKLPKGWEKLPKLRKTNLWISEIFLEGWEKFLWPDKNSWKSENSQKEGKNCRSWEKRFWIIGKNYCGGKKLRKNFRSLKEMIWTANKSFGTQENSVQA